MTRRITNRTMVALALIILGGGTAVSAQDRRDEQFYLPGSWNWQFLSEFPEAAKLFNAFDYGHAVLYEKLLTTKSEATARALDVEYAYLTTDLLIRPPQFAIAEEAVMPKYAKLAWRAKQMFDWAHVLHRQIFDIYADPRLSRIQQDSLIERATDYYLSRDEYAFLAVPKKMSLMDDQYYSQSFRKAYPKFNGLIWAYHWLQVGLYEPFIEARTPSEAKSGIGITLGRFWVLVGNGPTAMPMASAIAPKFSAAHPRAAVIFDNLHMMHDIISDVLHNDVVPTDRKRAVIYAALDEFQDPTRNIETMEMWRNMADHMGGIAAMGGPATGLLKEIGATPATAGGMAGMQHGAIPGAAVKDPAPAASDHAGHAMPATPDSAKPAMPPMRHRAAMDSMHAASPAAGAMRALHERMLRDPIIRRRVASDTALRRLAAEAQVELPPMAPAQPAARRATPAKSPAARKPVAAKPSVKPPAPKVAPKVVPKDTMKSMPGMKHP